MLDPPRDHAVVASLAGPPAASKAVDVAVHVVSPLPVANLDELLALYATEWWTRRRSSDDVGAMLSGPSLTFGLVEEPSDELVGFTRVLSDGAYVALVLDVIVRRDRRGRGYGRSLMDAVLGDPRLANVHSVELVCQPELIAFYAALGFTDNVGRSRLMRRTADPVLTG